MTPNEFANVLYMPQLILLASTLWKPLLNKWLCLLHVLNKFREFPDNVLGETKTSLRNVPPLKNVYRQIILIQIRPRKLYLSMNTRLQYGYITAFCDGRLKFGDCYT